MDDNITRMKIKVRQLDEEIRTVVREQAESGHDGRQVSRGESSSRLIPLVERGWFEGREWFMTCFCQALEEAQQAIQELFGRIRNIKTKAEHSELMVRCLFMRIFNF